MATKRIIIIDDDEVLHFILREQFSVADKSVDLHFECNGQDALNYFKALRKAGKAEQIPDVILLDINMPVMGGWRFLEHWTETFADWSVKADVYLMSASSDQDLPKLTVDGMLFSIPIQFIEKPLSMTAIESILSSGSNYAA